MVKYSAGLTLISGVCWTAIAFAQTPLPEVAIPVADEDRQACVVPSAEDTEAAKQAFRDGQIAFSEGDYSHAAELWRWAYDRDCTAHALLLNLATAEELLGRPEQAAETLTRFNELVPDSPYVAANQKRVARLERARLAPVRPRREASKACPPPTPPVVPSETGGLTFPLGVALGGATASLIGGAFYLQARSAANTAAEHCGGHPGDCSNVASLRDGERARARAEVSGWVAGAGLGMLAGGLAWHFLSPMTESRAATSQSFQLGSSLGAGRWGLSLRGGF